MISPLVLKVNVHPLLTAAFQRDCFMVEASPAPRLKALFGSQSRVESQRQCVPFCTEHFLLMPNIGRWITRSQSGVAHEARASERKGEI
jgi:hypothetical protein